MKRRKIFTSIFAVVLVVSLCGCDWFSDDKQFSSPRLSMFVGLDISGSFIKTKYFDDSINFLAHYLYAHLNGLGGLEVPNVLFVSSIGGASASEAKTLYPIQTFQNKSVDEIAAKLREIFPKSAVNPYTDYNAFFEQIAMTVRNKNLVLRPISIVMVTDGIPDVKNESGGDYRRLVVKPLEQLARNVTIRVIYTSAIVGKNWQTKIPRQRAKIWTQDAEVMVFWKDPTIMIPGKPFEQQNRFFSWVKDNVDFGVRAHRVD